MLWVNVWMFISATESLNYCNRMIWKSSGWSLVGCRTETISQCLFSQFQDHFKIVGNSIKVYNLKRVIPVLKYFPTSHWHLKFCHLRLILCKSLIKVLTYRKWRKWYRTHTKFFSLWIIFILDHVNVLPTKSNFLNKKTDVLETVEILWKFQLKCKCF